MTCSYRKNIKAMYVVHPNFWLKTGVLFLKSTGISKKFWRKFVYVERVKDLFMRFPASHLLLPEIVYRCVAVPGAVHKPWRARTM